MRQRSNQTINVNGTDVVWQLDDNGIFRATFDDEEFENPTLKGLADKLRAHTKKKPMAIPVVRFEEHYAKALLRHGTVVGRHSGNRNILVRWDGDCANEQFRSYSGKLLRGD